MNVTYIGNSDTTELTVGGGYEVIAKDIQVFETFYKLKDIEGWWNGKYFKEISTEAEEDPEPFSEF